MGQSNGHRTEGYGARKGDWTCQCGQAYRVLSLAGEVRMWPKNSNDGYALEPIRFETAGPSHQPEPFFEAPARALFGHAAETTWLAREPLADSVSGLAAALIANAAALVTVRDLAFEPEGEDRPSDKWQCRRTG